MHGIPQILDGTDVSMWHDILKVSFFSLNIRNMHSKDTNNLAQAILFIYLKLNRADYWGAIEICL